MQFPLILVGDHTSSVKPSPPDSRPRQDYEEVARLIGAEIYCARETQVWWQTPVRKLDQRLKLDFLAAMHTWRHRAEYSSILSTSEKLAIPLAALSAWKYLDVPHIVIAHKLSSGRKIDLFRLWPLHQQFDHVITVCRAQAHYAIQELGVPAERVNFIYDKVDQLFFRPLPEEEQNYILAVGMEQRDYGTLIQALQGTSIQLIILASSLWSNQAIHKEAVSNVTYMPSRLSYIRLRQLYAQARAVVVPLHAVDYAAGVNVVLEAMSMGRPVIVSQTAGIQDYVVDEETGLFAQPGHPAHMREQILRLWSDDGLRQRLGVAARQAIVDVMNLDTYVQQVAQIAWRAAQPSTIKQER